MYLGYVPYLRAKKLWARFFFFFPHDISFVWLLHAAAELPEWKLHVKHMFRCE